jgi:hypothetical protein
MTVLLVPLPIPLEDFFQQRNLHLANPVGRCTMSLLKKKKKSGNHKTGTTDNHVIYFMPCPL